VRREIAARKIGRLWHLFEAYQSEDLRDLKQGGFMRQGKLVLSVHLDLSRKLQALVSCIYEGGKGPGPKHRYRLHAST